MQEAELCCTTTKNFLQYKRIVLELLQVAEVETHIGIYLRI